MRITKKSKKFYLFGIILVLLIGICIGGYLVLKSKTGAANISQSMDNLLTQPIEDIVQIKDSDNDGLADWQEQIFSTDPNNPDTDNDGYLDGEEIISGHDPLKPSPDDLLPENISIPEFNLTMDTSKNLTEQLARIMAQGITANKLNVLKDEQGEMQISSESLASIDQIVDNLAKAGILSFFPSIPESEIKIGPEAVAVYQAYLKTVTQAWAKLGTEFNQDPLDIAVTALETKDFRQLDEYIQALSDCYQEIKNTTVPFCWREAQQKQLQLLLLQQNIFLALKNIDEDPLKAMIALKQYANSVALVVEIVKQLTKPIAECHQQLSQ